MAQAVNGSGLCSGARRLRGFLPVSSLVDLFFLSSYTCDGCSTHLLSQF